MSSLHSIPLAMSNSRKNDVSEDILRREMEGKMTEQERIVLVSSHLTRIACGENGEDRSDGGGEERKEGNQSCVEGDRRNQGVFIQSFYAKQSWYQNRLLTHRQMNRGRWSS